ncbi:MAG: hypothetical protein K2X82_01215 [Gemmataceae bacterium]|nr:hypothetical protein [Gemmataceae bacterium]
MGRAACPLVVSEDAVPGVRVARFVRPDNLADLDDNGESITATPLYREFRRAALDGLAPGQAVVVNLGLVEVLPSAFFRLLIQVDADVTAAGGRLLLCCLTATGRKAFDIMGGGRTFPGRVRESEAKAVYDAKQPA